MKVTLQDMAVKYEEQSIEIQCVADDMLEIMFSDTANADEIALATTTLWEALYSTPSLCLKCWRPSDICPCVPATESET